MVQRRRVGPMEASVKRDLKRVLPEHRTGGMAALALELAVVLDMPAGVMSPRDLAALSGQLHKILLDLGKLQEPAAVLDPVDELARKRRERRVGAG